MLDYLKIHNFALIENLEIDCSERLNVITGETGSGKSIILGALALLIGEKADSSCIRNGEDTCTVDALISLPPDHSLLAWLRERGYECEDGALLIRRIIRKAANKSSIYLNGQFMSRGDLGFIGESLFDMHGQSEHQSLLRQDRQRAILDSYARLDASAFRKAYEQSQDLERRIAELQASIDTALRDSDYMQFALSEINRIDPKSGELEDLKAKIHAASQHEAISQSLGDCSSRLKSSLESLYGASSDLEKASRLDPGLKDYCTRLQSSMVEVDDISQSIVETLGSMSFSEEELDSMQGRLSSLQRLYKKYGGTYESVIKYRDDAQLALSSSDQREIELSKLQKAHKLLIQEVESLGGQMTQERKAAARSLCSSIEENLHDLGMGKAVFDIQFSSCPISINGADEVCFMLCANPGEAMGPISRIASGGELSRVMLAIKTTLGSSDEIMTMVFDEIDAGIGGSVALAVGAKLKALSQKRQVITITHLASIARLADKHFIVSKSTVDNRTYTNLLEASGEDRVHEIARMLSGSLDEASLSHARSLLGEGASAL